MAKIAVFAIASLLALVGLGTTGGSLWSLLVETPPSCATQISMTNAKSLVVGFLIKNGFSEDRATSVRVLAVVRDDTERWPTHSIQIADSGSDHTQFVVVGNGCGMGQLFDLGGSQGSHQP